MVLRSVGVLSVAKVMGTVYALMGLIIGAIFALLSMAGVAMNAADGGEAAVPGAIFGVGAIIIMPIFYGIAGFIGGIISGALYNVVAGLVGGMELNLEGPPPSGQYA